MRTIPWLCGRAQHTPGTPRVPSVRCLRRYLVAVDCAKRECPAVVSANITFFHPNSDGSTDSCRALENSAAALKTALVEGLKALSIRNVLGVVGISPFGVFVLYIGFTLMLLSSLLFLIWGIKAESARRFMYFNTFFVTSISSMAYLAMATGTGSDAPIELDASIATRREIETHCNLAALLLTHSPRNRHSGPQAPRLAERGAGPVGSERPDDGLAGRRGAPEPDVRRQLCARQDVPDLLRALLHAPHCAAAHPAGPFPRHGRWLQHQVVHVVLQLHDAAVLASWCFRHTCVTMGSLPRSAPPQPAEGSCLRRLLPGARSCLFVSDT